MSAATEAATLDTERVFRLTRAAGFYTDQRQAVLKYFLELSAGQPPLMSRDAFGPFMRARGVAEAELDRVFAAFDVNRAGRLDACAFLLGLVAMSSSPSRGRGRVRRIDFGGFCRSGISREFPRGFRSSVDRSRQMALSPTICARYNLGNFELDL